MNIHAQDIMTDWKELDGETALKEYIENQAYEHLNFDPCEKTSKNDSGVTISHRTDSTKVKIRDQSTIPNTPLVIINGFPTDNQKLWKSIKLKDLKDITLYKPDKNTSTIYGTRGLNGLILVKINKRKWRKIKRKYGR